MSLDVVAFEHEHDQVAPREDRVLLESSVAEIKGRSCFDQFSSFRLGTRSQADGDCNPLHSSIMRVARARRIGLHADRRRGEIRTRVS